MGIKIPQVTGDRKICDDFVVVKSERRKVFGECRNYSSLLAVSILR